MNSKTCPSDGKPCETIDCISHGCISENISDPVLCGKSIGGVTGQSSPYVAMLTDQGARVTKQQQKDGRTGFVK